MFRPVLKRLAQALDSRKIPYMIIGGQAVLFYGEPRLTKDIDVTLGVGGEQLGQLMQVASESDWQVLPKDPVQFVREVNVLPCRDRSSEIRIDLIFSSSPYEREAIARAKSVDLDGTTVRYAAVEDLIVHKVFAGRPRDLEDIRNILRKGATIDRKLVERALTQISEELTPELLERFRGIDSKS